MIYFSKASLRIFILCMMNSAYAKKYTLQCGADHRGAAVKIEVEISETKFPYFAALNAALDKPLDDDNTKVFVLNVLKCQDLFIGATDGDAELTKYSADRVYFVALLDIFNFIQKKDIQLSDIQIFITKQLWFSFIALVLILILLYFILQIWFLINTLIYILFRFVWILEYCIPMLLIILHMYGIQIRANTNIFQLHYNPLYWIFWFIEIFILKIGEALARHST